MVRITESPITRTIRTEPTTCGIVTSFSFWRNVRGASLDSENVDEASMVACLAPESIAPGVSSARGYARRLVFCLQEDSTEILWSRSQRNASVAKLC